MIIHEIELRATGLYWRARRGHATQPSESGRQPPWDEWRRFGVESTHSREGE
jgi:hypothetical protein